MVRPIKELKGFKKINLKPGEKKTVDFNINKSHLSFYNPVKKKWVAESGDFTIKIGSSSRDIRLNGSFTLVAK
jgi:beta-glucosidase